MCCLLLIGIVFNLKVVPVNSRRISIQVNSTVNGENLQVLLDLSVRTTTTATTRRVTPSNVAVLVYAITLIGVMTITPILVLNFLENNDNNVVKLALGKVGPIGGDVIYNVHDEYIIHQTLKEVNKKPARFL
jgi:hypothetical protein